MLIAVITHTAQEINVQNMNVELVAQMFKNYQSNVLFHLEGQSSTPSLENATSMGLILILTVFRSDGQPQASFIR